MRLNQKLIQYFTVIVFVSLAFGFIVFFFAVERSTKQSAIGKLEHLNKVVEGKLLHKTIDEIFLEHPHVTITELSDNDKHLTNESIKEGRYEWDERLQTNVNHLTVTTYPFVEGKHYSIQSQIGIMIIDKEYFVGIVMVVAWIFVFIIIAIIFFGELITRSLYTPFFNLVEQMKKFDVREENQELQLISSNITEIEQLNKLFQKTSLQSIQHYEALKEFTQNLSHELQTPMANIKGKIELMLDTNLTEQQMKSLVGMYDDVNKVTAINRSLILLMSLEHHELSNEKINISQIVKNCVADQEDLIAMNGVELTLDIKPLVFLKLNPLLAQVVFSNLISNSNRHNVKNGSIEITLNHQFFLIKNTGLEQEFSNENIFQRFKKSKHRSESIGIGLALVKKILTIYGYPIEYKFEENFHQFLIKFK